MKKIVNDGYPKYYSTYGRLLALNKQYSKGVELIEKAIQLEEDDNRKTEYSDQIFYVSVIKANDNTKDKSIKIENDLKDTKKYVNDKEKKII